MIRSDSFEPFDDGAVRVADCTSAAPGVDASAGAAAGVPAAGDDAPFGPDYYGGVWVS